MKTKILELLKGMTSDSKKESSKCEKELCEILTNICNKLETIEDSVGYCIRFYPDKINEIDSENAYTGMKKLPEIIYCNYGSFEFETSWLDIDFKSYFEDLKRKSIDIETKTIEEVEFSLNKHKEKLESLKKLTYETLDC